jgi:hypothetical protein
VDEKNDAAMHEEDEFRWCRSIEACMPGKKFPGALCCVDLGKDSFDVQRIHLRFGDGSSLVSLR